MKSLVRLSLIIIAAVSLSGCYKRRDEVIIPQHPLVGSWVLTDAAEGNSYGWQSIYTGLETGVFDFYGNGAARYTDEHVTLQGTWSTTTVTGGYYDEYGNYYNDVHEAMQVNLYDNYTHSSIDLYFDDVSFRNSRFVATYYNNNYIERYWFSRY
ncbi:hypothetical protein [Foetidibacter luteolus]|uniref:hypothetical protein n=1 Tax=Foetidibacter luteolus TaxID=2608880 RepID=UPI00129A61B7|nr:hypothetical protein [Foetidibacter luteolus]